MTANELNEILKYRARRRTRPLLIQVARGVWLRADKARTFKRLSR